MKFLLYAYYFLRSAALRGPGNTVKMLLAESRFERRLGIRTSKMVTSKSREFFHYQGAAYLPLSRTLEEAHRLAPGLPFYDIGSGRGRAVFMAEQAGYNVLTGIELLAELTHAAESNLLHYDRRDPSSVIRFVTANATEFPYASAPAVYFFFNPFNAPVMKEVTTRILATAKGRTWFIYMNPRFRHVLDEAGLKHVARIRTGWYTEALIYST